MILKPNGYEIGGISNGAIWAIAIEMQIYILAVVFKKILVSNKSKTFWGLLFGLSLLVNLIGKSFVNYCNSHNLGFVASLYSSSFLPYFYFFLIGIIGYKFKDNIIPFVRKNVVVLISAFLLWHLLVKYYVEPIKELGYYTDPITVLLAGTMVLGLAYSFGKHRLNIELSYGIYVWHMPVITCILSIFTIRNWLILFGAIGIVLILAVLSHIFIEMNVGRLQKRILKKVGQ